MFLDDSFPEGNNKDNIASFVIAYDGVSAVQEMAKVEDLEEAQKQVQNLKQVCSVYTKLPPIDLHLHLHVTMLCADQAECARETSQTIRDSCPTSLESAP